MHKVEDRIYLNKEEAALLWNLLQQSDFFFHLPDCDKLYTQRMAEVVQKESSLADFIRDTSTLLFAKYQRFLIVYPAKIVQTIIDLDVENQLFVLHLRLIQSHRKLLYLELAYLEQFFTHEDLEHSFLQALRHSL